MESSSSPTTTSPRPFRKVALIHDFLVSYGGAERVFEAIAEMFPDAPIYTLLYDKAALGDRFAGHDIQIGRAHV